MANNDKRVHYLVPHSSDQLQPLDIQVFGSKKRFMSNYKHKDDLSELTNQIIWVHGALLSAAHTFYCHSAFKATFDILMCSKVRAYQTSHVLELPQTNRYKTPNQKHILDQFHRKYLLPKRRIHIESFPTHRNNQ